MASYTKFHDNTIETKFVKQLVSKTNIPFISTWKPGDVAVQGMFYLTKDNIWKCLITGQPKTIMEKDKDGTDYFERVSPYVFGKEYYNITGHYLSNSLGYDSTTHFYLGQYLRTLRDLFNLDLMPFYNCFCGEYAANLDFTYNLSDKSIKFSNVENDLYKIYSVPVRFGQTYMIGIDSNCPIEAVCAIYNQNGNLEKITNKLNADKENPTYRRYNMTTMRFPSIYKTMTWEQLSNDQSLGQYERLLRLLIKVPRTQKTSLVVIEGDYRLPYVDANKSKSNYISYINMSAQDITVNYTDVSGDVTRPSVVQMDKETTYDGRQINIEETLISPLGLLQMSDGESYAFSNRLIEYLLQNVINPLDEFGEDITRVQNYIKSTEFKFMNHNIYHGITIPGVWDTDIQEFIYNSTLNSTGILSQKVDITGYVDKDAEKIITRGQMV